MRTIFRDIFLVNYRIEPTTLASVLPTPIMADLYEDHAFLSIVIGRMDRMRPAGVPRLLGINYNQVVYRAVVKVGDQRGVHFLRSDADSRLMVVAGNLMSFFRFNHASIDVTRANSRLDVSVTPGRGTEANIRGSYDLSAGSDKPPPTSLFDTLEEAKTWLVELFTAFDVNARRKRLEVVRIDRDDWDICFVPDDLAQYSFMKVGHPFTEADATLDSIIYAESIPYKWHRLETTPLE